MVIRGHPCASVSRRLPIAQLNAVHTRRHIRQGLTRHRGPGQPVLPARERPRVSPPSPIAISPSTRAAAPPTTPLPLPGPPLAVAKFNPPLTTAISPAARATIAPTLLLRMPIR